MLTAVSCLPRDGHKSGLQSLSAEGFQGLLQGAVGCRRRHSSLETSPRGWDRLSTSTTPTGPVSGRVEHNSLCCVPIAQGLPWLQ